MGYIIVNGEIKPGWLYEVDGMQSVEYNLTTYSTGQRFIGVAGITTFTYTGSGTQLLYEVTQFLAGGIEYSENGIDQPTFAGATTLTGFNIEYSLNNAEKAVQETTKISGFTIELIDYPFYSFEINETRI